MSLDIGELFGPDFLSGDPSGEFDFGSLLPSGLYEGEAANLAPQALSGVESAWANAPSLTGLFSPSNTSDPWTTNLPGAFDTSGGKVPTYNPSSYGGPPAATTSGKVGSSLLPWSQIDFSKLLYPQKQQPANNSGLLIMGGLVILLVVLIASRR